MTNQTASHTNYRREVKITYRDEIICLDMTQHYRANKQVVIRASTEIGEPYSVFSVCLAREKSTPGCTYLDTNNHADLMKVLVEQKIVEPTGKVGCSGFCSYPEVRILE